MDIKNYNKMEATVFNPAQQRILRMMSFVNDDDTMRELEKVLSGFFARKVDDELDQLIAKGDITLDTIENWSNEHLRTPYK